MGYIAVVEDDPSIQKLILYALHNNHYESRGWENGKEFYQEMLHPPLPDLILLDIMLPDMMARDFDQTACTPRRPNASRHDDYR